MSKPTPGPWEWDGKFQVGIPHKDGDTFFRTNPEDAALIAAAPDLLDLARNVAGLDHSFISEANLSPIVIAAIREWQEAARAAIAKAEGVS